MPKEIPDPIVFLDIDGVLNDHTFDGASQSTFIGYYHALVLNRILIAAEAKLVVTSAWRYHVLSGRMTLEGFDWLLRSNGVLSDKLIGVTRADTIIGHDPDGMPIPKPNERGEQVTYWRLENRHTGKYIVIDDLDLGISVAGHPFLQVTCKRGLQLSDFDRATTLFRNCS